MFWVSQVGMTQRQASLQQRQMDQRQRRSEAVMVGAEGKVEVMHFEARKGS